ncbi:MAG: protease inhibitor I42 family protein [Clostridiales bacterium]
MILLKRSLLILFSVMVVVCIIFVGTINAGSSKKHYKNNTYDEKTITKSPSKNDTQIVKDTEKPLSKPEIISLTIDNDGQTIQLIKGQQMVLKLDSNMTNGYAWEYITNFEKTILKEISYSYSVNQSPPGMLGVGGSEIWTYEALEKGEISINLAYMQFENLDKTAKKFSINVEVVDEVKTETVEKEVIVKNSIVIKDKSTMDNLIDIEGKYVDVIVSITNNKEEKITINHTSSMKSDFQLLDINKNVIFNWSSNKLFMAVLGETYINPGETKELLCSDLIDQKIINKTKYVKSTIAGTSDDFVINKDGYLLEIK